MLVGVSTRNYDRSVEQVPDSVVVKERLNGSRRERPNGSGDQEECRHGTKDVRVGGWSAAKRIALPLGGVHDVVSFC
jgi:hypothetical protein